MSEHYKAGMKASSFLKIGVNKNLQNIVLKKTCIYYIYIIKRNTQGLVSIFILLLCVLEDKVWKYTQQKYFRAGIRQEWRRPAFWELASISKYLLYVTYWIHFIVICGCSLYNFNPTWRTPIFKKLDAFIPALSLLDLLFHLCCFTAVFHTTYSIDEKVIPTPVCFFLLYIYIVNVCFFFEWHIFYKFSLTPIFKKLAAFIPALSLLGKNVYRLFFHLHIPYANTSNRRFVIPTPVCFFLLYYIYIVNVCLFE